jgi:exonuclease VII large subunit
MFDQVFSNLQKATESSVKMQQEMFQKWVEAFPTASSQVPTATDAMSQWRHKWESLVAESLKRQKEMVDRNYEAGIKALEDIFSMEEAKSPQEYQQKVTELYRKSFESLRQLSESQMAEFRSATEKFSELMSVSGR